MRFEEFWGRQQYTDDNDDKAFAKEVWELAVSIGVSKDGAHFGNYSQRLAEIAEGEARVCGELAEAKRRLAELEQQRDDLLAKVQEIASDHVEFVLGAHAVVCTERDECVSEREAYLRHINASENKIAELEQQRDELLAALEKALAALETCTPADYSTGHVIHASFDDAACALAEETARSAIAKVKP